MRSWTSASAEETRRIGEGLARELAPGGVLLLYGDLGAGKTVLVQGIAAGLGIDPREVQSPTFTLVREHRAAGGRLVHADLYRLRPEDVEATGLEESLAGPGIKVVEWAERLPFEVAGARHLEIARGDLERREIRELAGPGERAGDVRNGCRTLLNEGTGEPWKSRR